MKNEFDNTKARTTDEKSAHGRYRRTQSASFKGMPGDEGVWIIIFGDMIIFAIFFATYLFYRVQNQEIYQISQAYLNKVIGLSNTFILLTSSLFVVVAVQLSRTGNNIATRINLLAAITLGVIFCFLKYFEYREKFDQGFTLVSNDFFMFYYVFTGIHLLHVVIGLGVLIFLSQRFRRKQINNADVDMLTSGGAFWHLVDLLWVILFALFYLVG